MTDIFGGGNKKKKRYSQILTVTTPAPASWEWQNYVSRRRRRRWQSPPSLNTHLKKWRWMMLIKTVVANYDLCLLFGLCEGRKGASPHTGIWAEIWIWVFVAKSDCVEHGNELVMLVPSWDKFGWWMCGLLKTWTKKGGKCSLNSVTCGDIRCVTLCTLVMGLLE